MIDAPEAWGLIVGGTLEAMADYVRGPCSNLWYDPPSEGEVRLAAAVGLDFKEYKPPEFVRVRIVREEDYQRLIQASVSPPTGEANSKSLA